MSTALTFGLCSVCGRVDHIAMNDQHAYCWRHVPGPCEPCKAAGYSSCGTIVFAADEQCVRLALLKLRGAPRFRKERKAA